jgi:hypothetical protein
MLCVLDSSDILGTGRAPLGGRAVDCRGGGMRGSPRVAMVTALVAASSRESSSCSATGGAGISAGPSGGADCRSVVASWVAPER